MQALLNTIQQWQSANRPFALARVIQTWGSSPRPVGAALILNGEMETAGSVSGGCVEGAVIREALPILGKRGGCLLKFGVSNEEAWGHGLTCGGKLEVWLEPFPIEDSVWELIVQSLESRKGGVWVTRIQDGESTHHFWPAGNLPFELEEAVQEAWLERRCKIIQSGEATFFLHVLPPPDRLILVGAAHISVELLQLARWYGMETTVIDPRSVFAKGTQYPVPPDHLEIRYPQEVLPELPLDSSTYAVLLSHDPKIDDPALQLLLRSEVAYIGALGSKRTQEKRRQRLMEAGFSKKDIERIHGPVGLDIGARTPKEIALAIMAQIIAFKNHSL